MTISGEAPPATAFQMHSARLVAIESRSARNETTPLLHEHRAPAAASNAVKWYRTPSPLLLFPGLVIQMGSWAMTIAPRLEVYTQLVCRSLEKVEGTVVSASSSLPPGSDCRQSPVVAQKVAQFNLAMSLVVGISSTLTTGYWGGLSDRIGRWRIICLAAIGFLVNEATFLIFVSYWSHLPYQWLLVGPFLDGLVGGMPTFQAALSAYISDCSPAGSRTTTLSALGGAIFAGMAIGPTLGGVSVKWMGSVLAPFWIAVICHFTLCIFWGIFLPESTTKEQRLEARLRETERLQKADDHLDHLARRARQHSWSRTRRRTERARLKINQSLGFLSSLGILLPKQRYIDVAQPTASNTGEGDRPSRRDWNLLIVALGYSLYVSTIAIYLVKIQYSQFKFNLGPEANSYYITAMGITRTLTLLLIIPLLIKIFKGNPWEPTLHLNSALVADQEACWRNRLLYDSHFDLKVARISMLIDATCYTFVALNRSLISFIVPSLMTSFAGAAGPAMQSLALSLSPSECSGQVLATLSVLHSLTTNVIGPILFGLLFSVSVGTFPEAIFVVGAGIFLSSFIVLAFVRLAPLPRL